MGLIIGKLIKLNFVEEFILANLPVPAKSGTVDEDWDVHGALRIGVPHKLVESWMELKFLDLFLLSSVARVWGIVD